MAVADDGVVVLGWIGGLPGPGGGLNIVRIKDIQDKGDSRAMKIRTFWDLVTHLFVWC